MTPAFWDSSALVPLCVEQQPSSALRQLARQHAVVAWWATPVEMCSAFQRLLRLEQITSAEHAEALRRLGQLRTGWRELQPTEALRVQAELHLAHFTLRAADALQLAAASIWCLGKPAKHVFISGDVQLREAARQAGFQVVAA